MNFDSFRKSKKPEFPQRTSCTFMKFFSQNNSLYDQLLTPPRHQGRWGLKPMHFTYFCKTIQKLTHCIPSTNRFQGWSHCNFATNNRSSSKIAPPLCNNWFGRNSSKHVPAWKVISRSWENETEPAASIQPWIELKCINHGSWKKHGEENFTAP